MTQPQNPHLDARLVPSLENAIDRWLAARCEYKKYASVESEYRYNETYFALGAAWTERYPEVAKVSGAFERFRRGLISPEEE